MRSATNAGDAPVVPARADIHRVKCVTLTNRQSTPDTDPAPNGVALREPTAVSDVHLD